MPKDSSDQETDAIPADPNLIGRRDFLLGLRKWSAIVVGSTILGGLLLPGEAAGWVNSRASWINGGAGGWVNRGGSWINGGGAWINRSGRWINGGGAWINGGGGGAWVNRRGW